MLVEIAITLVIAASMTITSAMILSLLVAIPYESLLFFERKTN